MKIEHRLRQSKFQNSLHKAVLNIYYTSNFFRDIHQVNFDAYNLNGQHFNVLRILKGSHPQALQVGSIKDVMLDKGCDLSRLLDKLENFNYILRKTDEHNKRKINVTITPLGIEVADQISATMENNDRQYLDKLTEEEFTQLSYLLDKLRGDQE
jgi:DNA-binding MarR family transcriptional regulator